MDALNSAIRDWALKADFVACAWGAVLGVASFLPWNAALGKEPLPLGPMLRLAALSLVVAWTHFLFWLLSKMLHRQISSGYCALLFFGAWAIFFLIYNCLL
jgi:hypothetical protein